MTSHTRINLVGKELPSFKHQENNRFRDAWASAMKLKPVSIKQYGKLEDSDNLEEQNNKGPPGVLPGQIATYASTNIMKISRIASIF